MNDCSVIVERVIQLLRLLQTAIDVVELVLLEDQRLRDEPGADGKVLLGSGVIVAVVVSLPHPCVLEVPLPGDKLRAVPRRVSRQHRAPEVGKETVVALQSLRLEARGGLHEPHILRRGCCNACRLMERLIRTVRLQLIRTVLSAAACRQPAERCAIPLQGEELVLLRKHREPGAAKMDADFLIVSVARFFVDFFHSLASLMIKK